MPATTPTTSSRTASTFRDPATSMNRPTAIAGSARSRSASRSSMMATGLPLPENASASVNGRPLSTGTSSVAKAVALPEVVADDCDRGLVGGALLREREVAAVGDRHTERPKVVRRDEVRLRGSRQAAFRETDLVV